MEKFIDSACVYTPVYSSFNSFYPNLHFNIDVRIYGSFGPPCLLKMSISTSRCLSSVYGAWRCLESILLSVPFDTQIIPIKNVVYGTLARCLVTFWPPFSRKSVACGMLARISICLAFWIFLAYFFKNISTHCCQIRSELSKLSAVSLFSNVSKISETPAFPWRGLSPSCFKSFCLWIMGWCFSPETQPPILSSSCWSYWCWPAPYFWHIASRRTGSASGWLEVCLQPFPHSMNLHRHYVYHIRGRTAQAIGAGQQPLGYLNQLFRWRLVPYR